MRRLVSMLVLFFGSALAAQAPVQKVDEQSTSHGSKAGFHNFLPANVGLVVTVTSQDRLVELFGALAEVALQAGLTTTEPEPPEPTVDALIADFARSDEPVEGIDESQSLGLAIGVDLTRYVFLPSVFPEDVKKALGEAPSVEKGKYVVATDKPGYPVMTQPLRPFSKGDIVISVRPGVWLPKLKPMADGMIEAMVGPQEPRTGRETARKTLRAAVTMLAAVLDSISQIDLALTLDKSDVKAAVYVMPKKSGAVRGFLEALQAAEPPSTGGLMELLDVRGGLTFHGFLPPAAMSAVLDLVPWTEASAEEKSRDDRLLRRLINNALAQLDGRLAYGISLTGEPLVLSGGAVVGIRKVEDFRQSIQGLYESEAAKHSMESLANAVPGLELKLRREVFHIDQIAVDTLEEKLALPGQGSLRAATHFLAQGDHAFLVFARDSTDRGAVEAFLRRASLASAAKSKPLRAKPAGEKRFLRGTVEWGEFLLLGKSPSTESRVARPKASTRFELTAGEISLVLVTRTSLPAIAKVIAAAWKLAPTSTRRSEQAGK